MRFFPNFVLASSVMALGAGAPLRAQDFFLSTGTVVAGQTLSVAYEGRDVLERVRACWGASCAPFFVTHKHSQRARLGIPPLTLPGGHTLRVEGVWQHGGPFLEEHPFQVRAGAYPVGKINLAPTRDTLFTSGKVDQDSRVLAALYNQTPTPQRLWDGPFVRPSTGVVSSPFGAMRSYGDRPATNPHTGMDIAAPAGSPVTAPQRGRVAFAGWMESFGFTVLLDHGQSVYSYYLHMQALSVFPGQEVRRGDRLGDMGQEGVATGPHVHWSFVVNGERVEPQEWVDRFIP